MKRLTVLERVKVAEAMLLEVLSSCHRLANIVLIYTLLRYLYHCNPPTSQTVALHLRVLDQLFVERYQHQLPARA